MSRHTHSTILRVAAALTLLACSPSGVIETHGSFPEDVQSALEALPRAEVVDIAPDGLPNFIRGDLGSALTGKIDLDAAEVALFPAVEGISPVFRVGANDLRLFNLSTDVVGLTHARYRQYKNGMEVIGGELIVHLDPAGIVYAANGSARDGMYLPSTPSIDATAAVEHARTAAGGSFTFGTPRLVYVVASADASLHLAWEILQQGEVEGTPVRDLVYVDALAGTVVDRHPMVITARNRKVYSANNGTSLPGTLKISEGGAAVSDQTVMYSYNHLGTTYDCYKTLFGRDSYNGAGAQLTSTVHYSSNYANAYWDGSQMVFGDGDGSYVGNLAHSLDITAHELTHAVTDYTAELVYQNEPGALNEAMSDIFAATCEAWADGGVNGDTWKIGEDIWTPGTAGDAARYMDDPTEDGQSYDYYPERYTGTQDYGGVHLNSGIANLAFKLLVTGGTHPRGKTSVTVPGIGIDQASRIFYRALTEYMTSTTSFQGARTATVQAATDLYGATTAQAVSAAWDAVGAPGSTTPPAPSETVVLTNGTPKTGLSAAAGSALYFSLAVPAGATNLKFQLSGGSGDCDLYVRLGTKPTTSATDYKSEGSATAEVVNVTTASAGTYYVMVYAYAAFSNVTLVGSYTAGGTTPPPPPAGGTLSNGTAVTLSGAAASETRYTITIPAGASNLSIRTSGGTGDADLYVKFGAAPTTSSYDYRPYLDGNNETVTPATATAGTWHVMVRGYSAYSGLSLVASWSTGGTTPPPSGNVLTNGVPVSNLSGAQGTNVTYTFVVPAGATPRFQMSGGTGDADLYVKFGAAPTTSSYDYRPYLDGNNETVNGTARAGTWYVMLNAYRAYSGVTLVASY